MPPWLFPAIIQASQLLERLLDAFDEKQATPEEVAAVRARRDAINARLPDLDKPTK